MATDPRPAAGSARIADPFADASTVAIDGTVLAYRERGEGQPVVFVHGSVSDLRSWEEQLPSIGASYRAIAYSRRYARPNEDIPPGVDDQMGPHVEDLIAFLGAIDAAPAHLVGNSWGAFICLLTAIRRPDVVRTLVLEEPPVLSLFVSTPPRPTELIPLLLRRPRLALAILGFGATTVAPTQRAFQHGDDDEAMRRFGSGVLGKDAFEQVPPERMQQVRDNLNAFRAQLLGAGFPPLAEDEVRGVAVQTLLLTGERSPAALRLFSAHLADLLPNAQQVEVEGASHRMHEERPAAVNEAIVGFLGEVG